MFPKLSTIAAVFFWGFVLWFILTKPAGASAVGHGIAGFVDRIYNGAASLLMRFFG